MCTLVELMHRKIDEDYDGIEVQYTKEIIINDYKNYGILICVSLLAGGFCPLPGGYDALADVYRWLSFGMFYVFIQIFPIRFLK